MLAAPMTKWSTKNRSVMEWIFFPLIFGRRDLNTFNYPQLSKFRRNQNWTWRSWFKSLMFGVWSLDRRDKETHSFEMESFILHCFQISLIILFLRNFLIQFQHSLAYDFDAVTYFDHVTSPNPKVNPAVAKIINQLWVCLTK